MQKKLLKERSPNEPEEEIEKQAQILGINAIKYSDLSCMRTKDYTFSYERMLRFEGNTAAFLLYSYVRALSIQRKANSPTLNSADISLEHPTEIELALHVLQFPEILNQVAQDLYPNKIADYLYALAEKFNAFFRDCHVLNDPKQNSRLNICSAVQKTFETGFHLLGLKTMTKM